MQPPAKPSTWVERIPPEGRATVTRLLLKIAAWDEPGQDAIEKDAGQAPTSPKEQEHGYDMQITPVEVYPRSA